MFVGESIVILQVEATSAQQFLAFVAFWYHRLTLLSVLLLLFFNPHQHLKIVEILQWSAPVVKHFDSHFLLDLANQSNRVVGTLDLLV